MNTHKLIETFYTSFSNGNSKEMADCYHKDIVFQDPVFGTLKGKRACKMWEMLLAKRTESTQISFDNIKTNADQGTATWKAEYTYGETNRKVINIVHANFKFKDGKIIEHIDSFNLWKWTQQAMGFAGYLFGWTPFLKSKIQKTTHKKLNDFINNK
ncbi:nuclear transport factor 2 family protein [Wenyingzhuangia sp. 2_MG-2023]|uniref:nuclear transport factor 2 family protein n=1 Tax=Wenyingzhuangia sp. 2_MG-2023 TaxID=3062639 RepID=UPI0026E17858|nr:nuclear transport factor 2 family protein [Wenyingzhuangia sp. 2_MG-2023]MDO6739414.1 nuclear transport factor 2 family protein [Wenyingzhuangia sp. 2_MG-2023]